MKLNVFGLAMAVGFASQTALVFAKDNFRKSTPLTFSPTKTNSDLQTCKNGKCPNVTVSRTVLIGGYYCFCDSNFPGLRILEITPVPTTLDCQNIGAQHPTWTCTTLTFNSMARACTAAEKWVVNDVRFKTHCSMTCQFTNPRGEVEQGICEDKGTYLDPPVTRPDPATNSCTATTEHECGDCW